MKNFKSVVFFLNLIFNCNAQSYVDVLKINALTTPNNYFDTSKSQTKLNQLDADLSIPIKLNEKMALVTGFIYESYQTKLFADGDNKNFGALTIKLGLNKTFNEHWIGTFILLPKISSDFKTTNKKDFQYGLIGIMKYKKTENLSYKFGMYFNQDLFGPLLVPLAGLYYLSKNKKFETNIMLPFSLDANYGLNTFMNIGFNFNAQLRTYHLTDVIPTLHSSYLARSTNELFAYLRFKLSKNILIQTKCGVSLGRSFRVYNDEDKVNLGLPATFVGDKRQQINSDFSNGLLFQASFIYRVNFKNK